MNFTYNATLDLMDMPVIRFPNQTEPDHRLLVFLKCFMVFILEHKDVDTIIVHRLQNHLVTGLLTLSFIMIALSAELIWKAIPMMMFCYACQMLKLYALDSDFRRCASYVGFVCCCIEITGFEFIYDVYFILCFFFKSLHSLTLFKDLEQKERGELQRVAMLLLFIAEVVVLVKPHLIHFRIIMFVNAVLTIREAVPNERTMHVGILYILMSKILIIGLYVGADLDGYFNEILKILKRFVVEFFLQFSHGV